MASLGDWIVGYEHAYGTYVAGGRKTDAGKVEGQARTIKGAVPPEAWEGHLSGEGAGLGIIALMEDNSVRWGAIDVDVYQLDLKALSNRIADLPLILFRSKSGGAHLYCFVREPVLAEDMQLYLATLAAHLGHGGVEVFPKQTYRTSEKDIGNWLNAPYFKAHQTMRYAIRAGVALSLEECVAYIEEKALTRDQFYERSGQPPEDEEEAGMGPSDDSGKPLFHDGPPCLEFLAANGGFPDGTRNEGMFNVAVYEKKKSPNSWRNTLIEYRGLCFPPMDIKELADTVEKSLSKKAYGYRCKEAPIAPHCNRKLCLKRRFGVGNAASGDSKPPLDGLTKYEGSPIMWVVEVQGKRMELYSEELFSQAAFGKRCMEVLDMVPAPLPDSRWKQFLNEQVSRADKVPASEDEGTTEGHFWHLVERFCTQRDQGKDRDGVLTNYVYTEDGYSWFRGGALLDHLSKAQFRFKFSREVWNLLERHGARKDTWTLRGKEVHVWGVPAFATETAETKEVPPEVGEKKDDVPF